MAATEALWNTSEDPAPFTVFSKIDTEKKENSFEIQIPYMLSLLSYDKFSGQVEGMNQIQKQYEEKYNLEIIFLQCIQCFGVLERW